MRKKIQHAALLAFGGAMSLSCFSTAKAENIQFPADSGVINVKTTYGVVGDGVADDTAAIQSAINANLNTSRILYFPNGTYKVSDKLSYGSDLGTAKRVVLQGQSQAGTIIKLSNSASGFGSASTPKALLHMFEGTSTGQAFRNSIFNMTFDTGAGNPGAVGVVWMNNNQGVMRDVTIKSSDANKIGVTGLDCTKFWPGPAYFKGVTVEGFNVGIDVDQYQYSLVFENLTLRNQKVAGIRNQHQMVTVRNLSSTNGVPVVQALSQHSVISIIGGTLSGGAGGAAIVNQGSVLLRDVTQSGYAQFVDNTYSGATDLSGTSLPGGEYVARTIHELFPSSQKTLRLPIEETPDVAWDALTSWVRVNASTSTTDDDTAAIQAAFDTAAAQGKTTVYFPQGLPERAVTFGDTVRVHGSVRRIIGLESNLCTTSGLRSAGKPLFRVESVTSPVIVFERLQMNFESGTLYNFVEHNSSSSLVMKNMLLATGNLYKATPAAGKVFIEDVCAKTFAFKPGQQVWARQINPEHDTTMVENDGATLWVLGLKTELSGLVLDAKNGSRTEILGGLLYPTRTQPTGNAAFKITDSQATITISQIGSHKYPNIVGETQSGDTRTLASSAILNWQAMPLFCSKSLGLSVSGHSLWLKADAGVTKDASNLVSLWDDQSSSNADGIQSTATAKPLYVTNALNGNPVLRFDGTGDFLSLPSGFANFTSGLSAFVVAKPTAAQNQARFFEFGNGTPSNNIHLARQGTTTTLAYRSYIATVESRLSLAGALPLNEAHLWSLVHQGGSAGADASAQGWKDGVSLGTGNVKVPNNVSRTLNYVGKSIWGGDALFKGDIAEIIVYPRALTVTERQNVENYLKNKYFPAVAAAIAPATAPSGSGA